MSLKDDYRQQAKDHVLSIHKQVVRPSLPREIVLSTMMTNPYVMFNEFAKLYGMAYLRKGGPDSPPIWYFQIDMPPIALKYILEVIKPFIHTDMKPENNFVGKLAELADIMLIEHWLHFIGIDSGPSRLNTTWLNEKVTGYGGDNGSDFKWNEFKFDPKKQDDNCAHGLFVKINQIETLPEDVILIHNTNVGNNKLNSSVFKRLVQDPAFLDIAYFPIAVAGYVSVKDFKKRHKNAEWILNDYLKLERPFRNGGERGDVPRLILDPPKTNGLWIPEHKIKDPILKEFIPTHLPGLNNIHDLLIELARSEIKPAKFNQLYEKK